MSRLLDRMTRATLSCKSRSTTTVDEPQAPRLYSFTANAYTIGHTRTTESTGQSPF